ncbi:hypothetical protein ACNOYE_22650 [Nannocystaceae bacterium ST9]
MGDERRWAARYQFLEELWRERDRIVFDSELEQALHVGVEGSPAELLARLLPDREPDARVWMTLGNDRRAASFARARSGTVFVGLDASAELATDEAWQVALIKLPALVGEGSGREQLSAEQLALLDVLGDKCSEDPERSVALMLACEPGGEERAYERLAELVEELFGDARIYGLARPGMAAAFDFGRLFEADDEAGEGEEPDVAIEVDTTLGSDPRFELYVAVIGDRVPAEGLTFIELPGDGSTGEPSGRAPGGEPSDEIGAMRAQLAEAQRRGDMQAIERLALLEKLEQAEDRAAGLGDELERLRDGGPSSRGESTGEREGVADPRLDAVLAREQSLRWELERVRGELDNLRARPVETLEAEAASLRARLVDAEGELERFKAELLDVLAEAEAEAEELEGAEGDDDDDDEHDDVAFEVVVQGDPPARSRERQRLRGQLDRLLLRLERGADVSALELHRELAAIRKSLG